MLFQNVVTISGIRSGIQSRIIGMISGMFLKPRWHVLDTGDPYFYIFECKTIIDDHEQVILTVTNDCQSLK